MVGEGVFLSVMFKDFLYLCGCLVLHWFLEASLQFNYRNKRDAKAYHESKLN